ncbi:MAG: OsmC family protein [Myxococcaceae bacterium]|nr:OsmC family protein [Myxococcaceae bacterium]
MHIIVESTEGFAQSITAGNHKLISDEPVAGGGKDAGPAPYLLVLSGLGSCTGITLKMYAQRKSWDFGKITVKLTLHKDEERVERVVSCSATLTQEQKDKIVEIAGKTPVTKTLLKTWKIETSVA